jgi:hypothetical protein
LETGLPSEYPFENTHCSPVVEKTGEGVELIQGFPIQEARVLKSRRKRHTDFHEDGR